MASLFFPISSRHHDLEMRNPALCEELRVRDILDSVGVMTNGTFVAAYELAGAHSHYHTEDMRNRAKESFEAVLRSIPDGKLHLLPFDGLTNEQGKYVLETHVVTYAPSATALHLLRLNPSHHMANTFLGVGGVIYSKPATALAKSTGSPPDFFDVNGVTFPDLPGSKQEVMSIAKIMNGSTALLLDDHATESALKALPLADFAVIHLAVHGVANPGYPDRAALVLGNSPGSSDDGLLQVREIRDLPIRADLVTLSACETGNGRLLGEEGIASLERAFLLAGAKSVIASLWTADDTYTIALMKRLYQHMIDRDDKGTALQQAKLDLLKEFGDQALPVYWAGFTLVGDGSSAIFK